MAGNETITAANRLPATPATLSYGLSSPGRVRRWTTLALRYTALPVGLAVWFLTIVVIKADLFASVPAEIVGIVAAVVASFGFVSLCLGFTWRRRGRPLRGIRFYLDERPPMIQLNATTGTRLRPLNQLRLIEVRYFFDDHDDSWSPWLRLSFDDPATGRTTRYRVTAYFLNHFTVDHSGFATSGGPSVITAQLRRLIGGHGIAVDDAGESRP